jgi:hypothetical protein
LESKHRDLKADLSILCSNAGFTLEAIRKAKRVGIGLIGITKQSDSRLKYDVIDEIYIRRIDMVPNSLSVTIDCPRQPEPAMEGTQLENIYFDAVPLINWIKHRIRHDISVNNIVTGTHSLNFVFQGMPLFRVLRGAPYSSPYGAPFSISGIKVNYSIMGAWFAQRTSIDATKGFYDWVKRAVLHQPNVSITYGGIKFGEGGTWIEKPSDIQSSGDAPFGLAQTTLRIADIGGLDIPNEVPPLDEFLDKDVRMGTRLDIAESAYISDRKKKS